MAPFFFPVVAVTQASRAGGVGFLTTAAVGTDTEEDGFTGLVTLLAADSGTRAQPPLPLLLLPALVAA